MERLHTRDHAKFSEARNVSVGNGFNMLDARTAAGTVVESFGVLVTVERRANAVIADGVGEKL